MNNILTLELAQKVNELHGNLQNKARLLVSEAFEIGELLLKAKTESEKDTFEQWLNKNINISIPTVNRYISLYNHRDQIIEARNLTEAYKMIETLEAQKKQSETAKAYQRVAEYKQTGVKPEGWRQHTDDKLAKEEADRDARIEAVKQEALRREEERLETEREQETQKRDWEREIERDKANNERMRQGLEDEIAVLGKRIEFKEKIRLSAEGMNDPFQDALIDYLDGLNDDNRRIEACYNIIKICKRIANELQVRKTA